MTPFRTAAESWLALHPSPFPLMPTRNSELESALHALLIAHPESSTGLEAAMLWIRIGHIEPAHEIVQSGTQGVEAYLHGVIHRIEGDFWNAKYWFRQVRSAALVEAIRAHIHRAYNTLTPAERPLPPTDDPALAVDLCARWLAAHQSDYPVGSEEYLTALAGIRWQSATEWDGLWLHIARPAGAN